MKLEQIIEGLLFATGESYTVSELARLVARDQDEVEEALSDLEFALEGRGIQMIRTNKSITLVAIKEVAPLLEALKKAEISAPLSQAALDTLSVVLYCSPIEKRHIDHIRGVDSRAMLRTLRSRDLVRESKSGSQIVYNPTIKLLRFMGIKSVEDMPDFKEQRRVLLEFINVGTEAGEE